MASRPALGQLFSRVRLARYWLLHTAEVAELVAAIDDGDMAVVEELKAFFGRALLRPSGTRFWCMSLSGVLLIGMLLQDLRLSMTSAFFDREGILSYALLAPLTFVGTVLPVLAVVWFWPSRRRNGGEGETGGSRKVFFWLGYVRGLSVAAGLLGCFYLIEVFVPVSVMPFTTTICGVLWLLSGIRLLRRLDGKWCDLAMAGCLCLILSIRFVDWNPRKPFMRDLYDVCRGMTVEEVETVMAHYIKGTGWLDPWRNQGLSQEEWNASGGKMKGAVGTTAVELGLPNAIVYRHSNDAGYDSDWGIVRFRDGRVETVELWPD